MSKTLKGVQNMPPLSFSEVPLTCPSNKLFVAIELPHHAQNTNMLIDKSRMGSSLFYCASNLNFSISQV